MGAVTPNGAAIRAIREARGISLRTFARLVQRDPSYCSRVEAGTRGAGDQTLHRFAKALAVPIEAITKE
ncbi:hypothetical protein GCM10010406_21750 [Streptomyces thermolineatus]|uniref:HTH cro/C1-type domain-containing protein n=1 Tax=Streptomyces thermolineatus TaxID=44033 RepID=A0ABN3LLQ3_9ACTN